MNKIIGYNKQESLYNEKYEQLNGQRPAYVEIFYEVYEDLMSTDRGIIISRKVTEDGEGTGLSIIIHSEAEKMDGVLSFEELAELVIGTKCSAQMTHILGYSFKILSVEIHL